MSRVPLTRFFCQELLFDYLNEKLTPERQREVAEFLKTDDVCREDLEHMKRAVNYCSKLEQIKTPPAWIDRWQNLPPALAKQITAWEMKMVTKLWRALPYTVMVLVVGFGLWIFKPWKIIANREVVVWQAPPPEVPPIAEIETVASEPPKPALPEKVAGLSEKPPMAIASPAPKSVPTTLVEPPRDKAPESIVAATLPPPPAKPEPVKAPEPTPAVESPKAEPAKAAADIAVEEEEMPIAEKDKATSRGVVFRASMTVGDFTMNSALVRDKVLELGGEKARKAELGWLRKRNESYFHFTLPESNQTELVQFLSSLGPVRISKDKHPVVMPPGKIRIILVVKESANNAGGEATP